MTLSLLSSAPSSLSLEATIRSENESTTEFFSKQLHSEFGFERTFRTDDGGFKIGSGPAPYNPMVEIFNLYAKQVVADFSPAQVARDAPRFQRILHQAANRDVLVQGLATSISDYILPSIRSFTDTLFTDQGQLADHASALIGTCIAQRDRDMAFDMEDDFFDPEDPSQLLRKTLLHVLTFGVYNSSYFSVALTEVIPHVVIREGDRAPVAADWKEMATECVPRITQLLAVMQTGLLEDLTSALFTDYPAPEFLAERSALRVAAFRRKEGRIEISRRPFQVAALRFRERAKEDPFTIKPQVRCPATALIEAIAEICQSVFETTLYRHAPITVTSGGVC